MVSFVVSVVTATVGVKLLDRVLTVMVNYTSYSYFSLLLDLPYQTCFSPFIMHPEITRRENTREVQREKMNRNSNQSRIS